MIKKAIFITKDRHSVKVIMEDGRKYQVPWPAKNWMGEMLRDWVAQGGKILNYMERWRDK